MFNFAFPIKFQHMVFFTLVSVESPCPDIHRDDLPAAGRGDSAGTEMFFYYEIYENKKLPKFPKTSVV